MKDDPVPAASNQTTDPPAPENEARYRELFENCRDAIYVHDLTGRYTLVNKAAEELSGYSRREIIGKHYSNFVSPRYLKEAREKFCLKLDAPIETTYEAEAVRKDGSRIPVEVSSRMIYEDGVAIGVQGTIRDITERKRAQDILHTYSHRLIEAQEAERQNIAHHLDNEISQRLIAIRDQLLSIEKQTGSDARDRQLTETIAGVNAALRNIREVSLDLRTSQLDELGLAAALRWYVTRYARRNGIAAEVIGDAVMGPIPHEIETACFRIMQEALQNTARHSRATKATVHLERRQGLLHLAVHDNGIGFNSRKLLGVAGSAEAGGLRGMQERAEAIKAQIEINSEPGSGTDIIVDVPLAV